MSDVVWVTGASGFTGQHQINHLRQVQPALRIVGIDVREIDRSESDATHVLDLNDAAAVEALAQAEPPTWVIHLAGLMPPASGPDMWRANVGGIVGLIVGLRTSRHRPRKIVNVGSAAEYAKEVPSPISEDAPCGGASAYGDTKLAQSLTSLRLSADADLATLVARPFNLIGPGLPSRFVVGSLVSQFASGASPVRVGNTHTARDFVDVRDAVRAYWLLALSGRAGEIYNVSSGESVRVSTVLNLLARISGHSPQIEQDAARVRHGDLQEVVGDHRKIALLTGWRPELDLERSLRAMLEAG